METPKTVDDTIPMRRLTGFDLFRKQEQETMKLDTTTPFKLTVHMPIIASKWKTLTEEDQAVYKSQAKDCMPVPLKSRKKKRGSVDESGPSKKRKVRDPSVPKRPLSAFIFFSCARRGSLMLENPDMKPTECLKQMGAEWKALTDRDTYISMATADKTRYKDEVAAKMTEQ